MLDVWVTSTYPWMKKESWWYYKGAGGGVSEYMAMPDVFSDSLQALHRPVDTGPMTMFTNATTPLLWMKRIKKYCRLEMIPFGLIDKHGDCS